MDRLPHNKPFSRRGLFSAFKHRNFRLFWTGQIISLTGTWMQAVGQGWLVFKLTNSPFYLGVVGTAGSLPILFFSLFGGVVADRINKRILLIMTQVASMFLALFLAILTSLGIANVWHVIILATFLGIVNAFDVPGRQSFIIEMVGKEYLLNAIALNSAAFNGARIIGPAIAGVLIGYLGIAACFYINAISFVAVIISLLRMSIPETQDKKIKNLNIRHDLLEGFRFIKSETNIYYLIALVAITSLFGIPYITFMPIYAQDILKIGPTGLGILMGFAGVGAFSGAMLLAFRADIVERGKIVATAGITLSVCLIIFSLSKNPVISCLVLIFIGMGMIAEMATVNSILQILVPDALRGRVMSVYTLFFLGMTPVGNLLIGILSRHIGTQAAIASCASICLFVTIALFWRRKELWSL